MEGARTLVQVQKQSKTLLGHFGDTGRGLGGGRVWGSDNRGGPSLPSLNISVSVFSNDPTAKHMLASLFRINEGLLLPK